MSVSTHESDGCDNYVIIPVISRLLDELYVVIHSNVGCRIAYYNCMLSYGLVNMIIVRYNKKIKERLKYFSWHELVV